MIAGFYVHQADALRGTAGLADGAGFDADDLALFGNDHQVGVFFYGEDADDFADAGGGLHVDDSLAAAGGQAVVDKRGAFAETVFGDGEDEAVLFDDFYADEVIAFFQLHAADAAGWAAHGSDVGFLEAAGHAFVRA